MARSITAPEGQLAYRRRDAAKMLGVSTSTLDRLVHTGQLTAVAVSPRTRVITADELTKYLLARSVTVIRTGGGAE